MATLAERVFRLRAAAGWTQEELAERCGIPAQTISAVENGRKPRAGTLRKLAAGLGLTVEALLGEAA